MTQNVPEACSLALELSENAKRGCISDTTGMRSPPGGESAANTFEPDEPLIQGSRPIGKRPEAQR